MASTIGNLVNAANRLLEIAPEIDSNPRPERRGGFLTWVPGGTTTLLTRQVGIINPSEEYATRYEFFSQEKAIRLLSDFKRNPRTTVSSMQTRNEAAEQYGGAVMFNLEGFSLDFSKAIKLEHDIISFSGSSEEADQTYSLILGELIKISVPSFSRNVIGANSLSFYSSLLGAYNKKFFPDVDELMFE